jgi:hypothetical protein
VKNQGGEQRDLELDGEFDIQESNDSCHSFSFLASFSTMAFILIGPMSWDI